MKMKTTNFRFLLVLATLLLFVANSGLRAQVAPYFFMQSTAAYTPITGGTILGTATNDDQFFVDPAIPLGGTIRTGVGFPIGFDFTFQGIVFNRFGVNSNGWISLGQSTLTTPLDMNTTSSYTPLSSTFANVPAHLRSRISALGRDLQGQTGATIQFLLTGTAPNRVLVIQWANYKRFGTTGAGDFFNFQIRLHETTNRVDFHYGSFVMGTTTGVYQVGLGGSTPTDFVNRTTTTDWAATTAGTVNTATCTISATVFPPNGLMFSFLVPIPGSISGVVRDNVTNNPINGAVVSLGARNFLTGANGVYSFANVLPGAHTLTVVKAGYTTLSLPIFLMPGQTLTQNLLIQFSPNAPGAVLAQLNAAQTAVDVSWGLPSGLYDIIYDDGTFENMTAWGVGGNMNAIRFTPAGYPCTIRGGAIHIGDGTYPAGGNVLVPFQVAVFDDDGPGGYPGTQLGIMNVTPTATGWVVFNLAALNITINSGDFYIAMVQGGNFPNCAPIAINQNNPVFRSYSRFATGGAPWTVAGFNDFMIRALVEGPGGTAMLGDGPGEFQEPARISEGALFLNSPPAAAGYVGEGLFVPVAGTGIVPESLLGYSVSRMREGEENTPGVWVAVGNSTTNAISDPSWPTLADGAYRWAVRANYAGNVSSGWVLSNLVRKNWASNVTINVTLSDPDASLLGVAIGLTNTVFPQYNYVASTNASGVVNFPEVWKGNYNLVVQKFGYNVHTANVNITENTFTRNVHLLEIAHPPSGLTVNPITLMATWQAPALTANLLLENWAAGNFTANNWTFDPAQGNWVIATAFGNPAPAARFSWTPSVTNYNNALVSREFNGLGMPSIWLKYDLHLSNFSTATLEQFAVEVWNGATWVQVANYTNAGGNIAWTSFTHDISAHAVNKQFRVRFRAYGANSFNINNWDLDNVQVYVQTADGGNRGVIGYFVSLDAMQVAFTEETNWQLDPYTINYGQSYTASVRALYESGISTPITHVFTSQFLFKPCNLQGEDIDHAVELTWEAPGPCWVPGGGPVIVRTTQPLSNEFSEFSPVSGEIPAGERALFDLLMSFPVADVAGTYSVATDGDFVYSGMWNAATFHEYTMAGAVIGPFTVPGAGSIRDLAYDGQFFYGSPNSNTIFQMNFANNTVVGTITAPVANVRGIAYDADADGFWITNGWAGPLRLISRTGTVLQTVNTTVGSISGLAWDDVTPGGPYLWAYTQPASNNILVQINLTTGAAMQTFDVATTGVIGAGMISGGLEITNEMVPGKWTLVGCAQNNVIWVLELAPDAGGGGGGAVPTAGFKIYRNNVLLAQVAGNTFSFTDSAFPGFTYLPTGTYNYSITALYNHAGGTVESLHEGPISVFVEPGMGFVTGIVYNCETNQPIAGVTVSAGDFSTTTAANGTYTLVAHEGTHTLTISKPFYFTKTFPNFNIMWLQTHTVNACLEAFEVYVTPTAIHEVLPPGGASTHTVTITNNSSEPSDWDASIAFVEEGRDNSRSSVMFEPTGSAVNAPAGSEGSPMSYTVHGPKPRALFDLLMDFPVADVAGTYSVATDGNFVYSGMWNAATFHEYTMAGAVIGPFTVPGAGSIRDLAHDGQYFYGSPNSSTIFQMDFVNNTVVGTITAPVAQVRGIAYDASADGFWITNGWAGPLRLISRTGATIKTLNTTVGSISGLAWDPATPGGPYLWAYTQPSTATANILVQIDLDTGAALQTFDVTTTGAIAAASISGGLEITNEMVPGKWTFIGCAQNDVIWVLELAPAATWLTVNPTSGTLAPGASANVSFNFNTDQLVANDFKEAVVTMSTDPNIGAFPIDVSLLVEGMGAIVGVNPASLVGIHIEYPQVTTDLLNISNTGDAVLNFDVDIDYHTEQGEDLIIDEGFEGATFPPTGWAKFNPDGGTGWTTVTAGTTPIPGWTGGTATAAPDGGTKMAFCTWNTGGATMNDQWLVTPQITVTPGMELSFHLRCAFAAQFDDNVEIRISTTSQTSPAAFNIVVDDIVFTSTSSEDWLAYDYILSDFVTPGTNVFIAFRETVADNVADGAAIFLDNVKVESFVTYTWLTVSPVTGSVNPGDNTNLTVMFNSAGLTPGQHLADILLNSNDPGNPVVTVPVALQVGVGIDDPDAASVLVYPVPASDMLNVVTGSDIRSVRMFNYKGQIVYEKNIIGGQTLRINVKPFNTGAYILQFITSDGQTHNQRIIVNR